MLGWPQAKTMLVALTLFLIPVAAAHAIPITGLFNTGVNASGATQANNAAELHYTLVTLPSGTSTNVRVATSANGFPIPPWVGDNSTSAWIGPTGATDLTGGTGDYDYRTTFTLSAQEAAGATITGNWSVDNSGVDILLNGTSTRNTATDFSSFYKLSISAGFVAGVNMLDFVVNNAGGPTGLRTELVGNIAVPEPASIVLLATALLTTGLLGAVLNRRKRAKQHVGPVTS